MKRIIQFSLSVIFLLIIISGCSEDDVVSVEEIYSLSGEFTNVEGEPLTNEMFLIYAMEVNDNDPLNIVRDTLFVDSAYTNSVGIYEFNDLYKAKTYKIEPFSTAYKAKPDSYYVKYLSVGNNSLNFTGTPVLKGEWESSGERLPELSPFEQNKELESIKFHVGPGDYYYVGATYADLSYEYTEGVLGLSSAYSDSINYIDMYLADAPDSALFKGIFKVYGDSLNALAVFELIRNDGPSVTPPDAKLGFGSSNAGIDSSKRVFRMIRTSLE